MREESKPQMFLTLSLLTLLITSKSARASQSPVCEIKGDQDKLLASRANDELRFEDGVVVCMTPEACSYVTFNNCRKVVCQGNESCMGSHFINVGHVVCQGKRSCATEEDDEDEEEDEEDEDDDYEDQVYFSHVNMVECNNELACLDSVMHQVQDVRCNDVGSCYYAVVSGSSLLLCHTTSSNLLTNNNHREQENEPAAALAPCAFTHVTNVSQGGLIRCYRGIGEEDQTTMACASMTIDSPKSPNVTVACLGEGACGKASGGNRMQVSLGSGGKLSWTGGANESNNKSPLQSTKSCSTPDIDLNVPASEGESPETIAPKEGCFSFS